MLLFHLACSSVQCIVMVLVYKGGQLSCDERFSREKNDLIRFSIKFDFIRFFPLLVTTLHDVMPLYKCLSFRSSNVL